MRILMVGSGGREHALIRKLKESPRCEEIYCAPGNGGISKDAVCVNISVEDIASTCGLNRSYFGKIFKNAVGKSPQEFLLNYRMIKACELLKLTQLSIGDISSAVGYDNQLHFSRAFKNIYGISPRDWRKQNRLSI